MKQYNKLIFKSLVTASYLCGINTNISNVFAEDNHSHHKHEHHEDSHHIEETKGEHGGRLLGTKEFQAEVTIYEPNIPPQSRVYFYEYGKPVNPDKVTLKMELHRVDRVDTFTYKKQENYLVGEQIVEEPHSFDVKIFAKYKGKSYHWKFSTHEGRTELTPQAIKSAGIKTEIAGPATLRITTQLNGKIVPNEYRSMHVTPRFSGVVKELKKELGDEVKKGDVIAIVESNESLSEYKVRSKIDGTIIQRNVSPGEVLSEGESMYVISDLSTVWADFKAYSKDLPKLKKGQKIILYHNNLEKSDSEAEISYISPVGSEDSQMFLVRAVIKNKDLQWKPGLYLTGDVVLENTKVPVAVKTTALQTFRDWNVVFQKQGNIFEIVILELGKRDGQWVEVISGLKPNTHYVTENSFVLKADVLKSGATHDH